MIQNLVSKPGRYWHARTLSFTYAFAGIVLFFRSEQNARIHLAATAGAVAVSCIYGVSLTEAVLLVMVTALVWAAEMFNTCIEKIMDFISMERHPQIKFIKDVAAGAVLVTAIAALITGLIIFIPKIF
ncbi:MAG TPA: diacylglycerol kinase family protein [Chitinophagaceae bacterium]|nr:diacylglycerol kinase family protein [Chitinophagaceae bacterium]